MRELDSFAVLYALALAGRGVDGVAVECGVSRRTVFRWKRLGRAPRAAMRQLAQLATGVPVHARGWSGWRFCQHEVCVTYVGRDGRQRERGELQTVLMDPDGEWYSLADLRGLPALRERAWTLEQERRGPMQLTWVPLR